jgi:hypothetical protein
MLVLCVRVAGPAPRTNAETTGVAVIACENIAAYLDGDPNDGTLPAEEDLACLQPIPPTGPASIQALANGVGDSDGTLQQSDLQALDLLDHNRVDATCTYQAVVVAATKPAMGCTLLAFVFVDDEAPVTLDVPSGLTSIEAGGAQADFVCSVDGSSLGQDAGCSDVPASNDDGVVIFRILNFNATNGNALSVFVQQEAVEQSVVVNMSGETRFDPSVVDDADGDGVGDDADNCPLNFNPTQLNTDNAPIVTQGIGPLDQTIPSSDPAGDACDDDDDNDGPYDDEEDQFGGNQSPPAGFPCIGATGPTNPALADTDGDRILDGAECLLGSNPLSAASRPPDPQFDADSDGLSDAFEAGQGYSSTSDDSDGDGIKDGVEFKGYMTLPPLVDTDGDGCNDNVEITSQDTNTITNSNDLLIVSLSFNSTTRVNPDINKNGIVNSTDLFIVALNFNAFCNLPD